MKPTTLSQDIVPLSRFRSEWAETVRRVRANQRPVVVPQHGESAFVVLDVEQYEAMLEELEFVRDIAEAKSPTPLRCWALAFQVSMMRTLLLFVLCSGFAGFLGCAVGNGGEPARVPAATAEPAFDTGMQGGWAAVTTGCVDDVASRVASEHAGLFGEAVVRSEVAISALRDVDGDNADEQLAYVERLCGSSGICTFALFRSANGCTTFAGPLTFSLESEEVLATSHNGLRDLRVFLKSGCAGQEGVVETLAWDGARYAPRGRVACGCPETEPGAVRHPSCP